MARLSSSKRNSLPAKSFAQPGKRAYPINDRAHAANALSRASRFASPSAKAAIKGKVCARYPSMPSCRRLGDN